MTTKAIKGIRGDLRCTTEFDIGDRRILQIETSRNYRKQLSTDATVFTLSTDGRSRQHAFDIGNRGGGDFRRTLTVSTPARATAAVIEAQHATALAMTDAIRAEAIAHYADRKQIA